MKSLIEIARECSSTPVHINEPVISLSESHLLAPINAFNAQGQEPYAWQLKGNVGSRFYTDYEEAIKWQALDGMRGKVDIIPLYTSPLSDEMSEYVKRLEGALKEGVEMITYDAEGYISGSDKWKLDHFEKVAKVALASEPSMKG